MTQEENLRLYNQTKRLLKKAGESVDLMKVAAYEDGIGSWVLDCLYLDEVGEPIFESNFIHEASIEDIDVSDYHIKQDDYEIEYVFERLDDAKKFHWSELSDGDKQEIPVAIRAYLKAEKKGTLLY